MNIHRFVLNIYIYIQSICEHVPWVSMNKHETPRSFMTGNADIGNAETHSNHHLTNPTWNHFKSQKNEINREMVLLVGEGGVPGLDRNFCYFHVVSSDLNLKFNCYGLCNNDASSKLHNNPRVPRSTYRGTSPETSWEENNFRRPCFCFLQYTPENKHSP